MLIFLTSLVSKTLDKLIPHLPRSTEKIKVAFIPTAADLYVEKSWIESDMKKFIDLNQALLIKDGKEELLTGDS